MRVPRFVHVGISYMAEGVASSVHILDQVIDSEALDWYRYSFCCYLLWTSSDCETICRKILRVPGFEYASAFVSAIDIADGFASFPSEAWAWLKRDRGYGPLQTWTPPDSPPMPPPLPPWTLPDTVAMPSPLTPPPPLTLPDAPAMPPLVGPKIGTKIK